MNNNEEKDDSEIIKVFRNILPTQYAISNDTISNNLDKLNTTKSPYQTPEGLFVFASMENTNVSLNKKVTPFDRIVHNTICSLFLSGNSYFTAEMVYRTMNGLTNSETATPQSIGAITRSIDKCRTALISIDYTQELQKVHNDTNIQLAKKESYFIPAEKASIKIAGVTGGKIKDAYKIFSKPLLLEYSQMIGRLIIVPSIVLKTKNVVRLSDDNILIKDYLIRCIASEEGTTIELLYKTVFEETDLLNKAPAQLTRYKDTIRKFLNYWIEVGFIEGYSEIKEHEKYIGIMIEK